ncbi:ABC transporter substrate-binding protein [Cohnella lupini]|uniref:Carbohydrate ABC transporter substrate-binding protein (CUT1 family) n=1 Tax=Cohnella lupini TaxID=1294267 RepID=A0A3D9HUP5_9BACL|nr:extracellular solute-binding protein [Cohnella lupini]RED53159.1 carbohydrate ABC transporter substrate-binding protein (CUT1 family) [Cohnella lupini]
MKKKRMAKGLSGLMAVLMLTGLLAACGGNNDNASPSASSSTEGSPAASTGSSAEADPAQMSGTVKVWDWDEAFQTGMIAEFNKKYPNIKVEVTVVNPNDYLQKLQSGIASGSDVPDVILGESAYRGKLFDLDVLDNLEAAPYNFDKSTIVDYVLPYVSNSKGEVIAVDQSLTPAGFAYRRDLAKQYWGTDDPAEIAAMIPTWDDFIAKGTELKDKSGGKVLMFPGLGDAFLALKGQNFGSYVNGTEIDLTTKLQKPLQKLFQMKDAGILGKNELWTPAWSSSMAKGEFMFYPMAPWGAKWHIAANDPDGSGHWGLVKAPEGGFTRGGTAVGIYKDSKVKDAAWAFIQYAYLSDEGSAYNFKTFGNMTSSKSFYETQKALIEAPGPYDEFFGGQNLASYFMDEIVPEVQGEPQSQYDSVVDSVFNALYPLWTKDGSATAESALKKFIDETKIKANGATIK